MSELGDTSLQVVHPHEHSLSLGLVLQDSMLLIQSRIVITFERHSECAWALEGEISALVLISKGMSTNDNRFLPIGD